MKIKIKRFTFPLILFFTCISPMWCAYNCDINDVYSVESLSKDYAGIKGARIYHDPDRCINLGDGYLNWGKDCENCSLITRINTDVDTSFNIVACGMDYVLLFLDGKIIEPIRSGQDRVAFNIPLNSGRIHEILMKVSLKKNRVFFIRNYSEKSRLPYSLVDYGRERLRSYFLNFAFLGALFIIAMINFVSYSFNRRKDYLHYGFYATAVLFFFGSIFISMQSMIPFRVGRYAELISHPLMYIAYIGFLRHFLETRTNYPWMHKVYHYTDLFLLTSFVLVAIGLLSGLEGPAMIIYEIFRIGCGLVSFYLIYYLIKHYNRLVSFLVIGHIALTIGSLMAMYFTIFHVIIGPIRPLHWMMAGVMVELIMFSAGVGYRTFLANKDRLQFQDALINEMKKNESLMSEREEVLNEKVEAARSQIIIEEKNKLLAEFSLKQKEIELGLLRNQMNPHFIFNSLNSIKSFIIKNQPRIASEFLTKFATLMRLILSNSKENEIPLSREIKAVSLYMELEQIRLMNKFSFEFDIGEDVDTEEIKIQPLILQPFIENAIWHGIRYKKDKGLISIKIEFIEGGLRIVISDDGIGREAAGMLEKSITKSRSYGIEITRERLRKHYKEGFQMSVSNIFNEREETGTKVSLYLPIVKSVAV